MWSNYDQIGAFRWAVIKKWSKIDKLLISLETGCETIEIIFLILKFRSQNLEFLVSSFVTFSFSSLFSTEDFLIDRSGMDKKYTFLFPWVSFFVVSKYNSLKLEIQTFERIRSISSLLEQQNRRTRKNQVSPFFLLSTLRHTESHSMSYVGQWCIDFKL